MVVGSVSDTPGVRPASADRRGGLPVDVLESKLYAPTVRRGVIPRPELLDRLQSSRALPTGAVAAPPSAPEEPS
jgi:hypothetical protein